MKISELSRKRVDELKVGAKQGSQKWSRMGTDDPSKYMGSGEWEAYREPQGVNSTAGKIAGGRKKGTTKSKNKKMSESVYSDKSKFKTQWTPSFLPDPKSREWSAASTSSCVSIAVPRTCARFIASSMHRH